jgi:hypothetical protein
VTDATETENLKRIIRNLLTAADVRAAATADLAVAEDAYDTCDDDAEPEALAEIEKASDALAAAQILYSAARKEAEDATATT